MIGPFVSNAGFGNGRNILMSELRSYVVKKKKPADDEQLNPVRTKRVSGIGERSQKRYAERG